MPLHKDDASEKELPKTANAPNPHADAVAVAAGALALERAGLGPYAVFGIVRALLAILVVETPVEAVRAAERHAEASREHLPTLQA